MRSTTITIQPGDLSPQQKRLLISLFNTHKGAKFFDNKSLLTDLALSYRLQNADEEDSYQDLSLGCRLVRIPRDESDDEIRFAVCCPEPLAIGFDGVIYLSVETLRLKVCNGVITDVSHHQKTEGVVRLLKNFLAHKIPECDEPLFDFRLETDKAIREHLFLQRIGMPGLKPPVLDHEHNRACIIMRQLDGIELLELLQREYNEGPILTLTQRKLLSILICEAVLHLHEKGVIHRDLKPENILVDLDEDNNPRGAVIVDLGHAKFRDEAVDTDMVGSSEYISPEAEAGITINETADIYALSKILYLLWQMQRYPEGPLSMLDEDEASKLVDILTVGMHATPAIRASATDILQVLNHLKTEAPAHKRTYTV